MMRGMFAMAAKELQKPNPVARNVAALVKIFEVGAKLELETVKHADSDSGDINVNVGVQVGKLPIVEIVVADRNEAREFAEIKQQLLESVSGNGEKQGTDILGSSHTA